MFTGIISKVAKVEKAEKRNGSLFFIIQKPKGWKIKTGDSIATDGACLTAIKVNPKNYTVELMPETLNKTSFGKKIPDMVNLEQPLKLQDKVDGHFVLGHIDAIGRIEKITKQGLSSIYQIGFPKSFSKLVVDKGSITVDGISLTIVKVLKNAFTVAVMAYTLNHTTLGQKKVKEQVNLEFDILAKYFTRSQK